MIVDSVGNQLLAIQICNRLTAYYGLTTLGARKWTVVSATMEDFQSISHLASIVLVVLFTLAVQPSAVCR